MKLIQKSREPRDLQEHRGKNGTDYQSYSNDVGLGQLVPLSGLRKILLEDQGFICAYCMKRIPHKFIEKGVQKDDFKIEHWIHQKSQESIDRKLDITFTNIFACCMGNEGQKPKFQTCDTKKGRNMITISPLNPSHIRTLNYAPDGSIHSTNVLFEDEINNILNLNEDNLRKQREAIYKLSERKVKEAFRKPHIIRAEKDDYLDQQIRWWSSQKDGKLSQFCMVAVTYLESRKK